MNINVIQLNCFDDLNKSQKISFSLVKNGHLHVSRSAENECYVGVLPNKSYFDNVEHDINLLINTNKHISDVEFYKICRKLFKMHDDLKYIEITIKSNDTVESKRFNRHTVILNRIFEEPII